MRKIDDKEYNALRNEMVMRVQLMNTHNVGMIMAVIAIWSIAGLFIQGLLENEEKILAGQPQNLLYFFMWVMVCIFMLIPVAIQLSLAIKSGDNLAQIASIAGYIKVFVEIPSILARPNEQQNIKSNNNQSKNQANNFVGWECLQKKEVAKPFNAWFFNSEYCIVASISTFLYGLTAAICCIKFWVVMSVALRVVAIVIFSLFFVVSFLLTLFIFNRSTTKAFIKAIKDCGNFYLNIASKHYEYFNDGNQLTEEEKNTYRSIMNIGNDTELTNEKTQKSEL